MLEPVREPVTDWLELLLGDDETVPLNVCVSDTLCDKVGSCEELRVPV